MSKPEPSEAIEIPIPWTGKTVRFSGAMVFIVLLILAAGFLSFSQLGQIHDEIERLRADLVAAAREVNCKLDLDIFMYGRPPERFNMRDMPRDLFGCLPKWVGDTGQQIAPREPEKKE